MADQIDHRPLPEQPLTENARQELAQHYFDEAIDPKYRLGTHPSVRLPFLLIATGILTFPLGLFRGSKVGGLKYLAENSHRLPGTVQGWYFYHKQKNYIILKDGMIESFKFGVRSIAFVSTMFGIEALLDWVRGQIDFMNTVAGASAVGFLYAARQRNLPRSQIRSTVKSGARLGLIYGLLQDTLRAAEGQLWYVNLVKRKYEDYFPPAEGETESAL
ncbi:hypothetical protein V1525DRAFT_403600 [Lipomyces kononenkoae]|uniref:Uncharacterized protein n=1 Tax=Lipomyces kononenkoae TaxID=34357 RepID=A0ACC3T1N2_LIPKO